MPYSSSVSQSQDPTRLNDHLRQCAFALGPLHRAQCAAEAVDDFLAPRFVSLLLLMSALVLASASLPL